MCQSGAAAELTAMRERGETWEKIQMKFIAAKIFVGAAWEGAEGVEKKTISETNREGDQKCPLGALLGALSPLLSSL